MVPTRSLRTGANCRYQGVEKGLQPPVRALPRPRAVTSIGGLVFREGTKRLRVAVEEQGADAEIRVIEGAQVLVLRPGLVSPRAFVALVLALDPLQESRQYLQGTG